MSTSHAFGSVFIPSSLSSGKFLRRSKRSISDPSDTFPTTQVENNDDVGGLAHGDTALNAVPDLGEKCMATGNPELEGKTPRTFGFKVKMGNRKQPVN